MMHVIELNAENWKTAPEFYDAVLAALGAPKCHGRNLNALVDSMVWGGMNSIEPPYTIRILRADRIPKGVRDEIELAKDAIAQGHRDFRARRGSDIGVYIETDF
jgi:RNAse (barnase) inhibitor barstar